MDRIKLFLRLALLILPAIFSSCSDDFKYPSHGPEGSLDGTGESRSTVFHILEFHDHVFNGEVTFELCNPADHLNLEFPGSVLSDPEMEIMGKRGALTCRMAIGEREIPDGRYLLTVKVGDNHSVPFRLIRFENNVAVQEEYDPVDYSDLEGSGTEEDPYLIKSPSDFLSLQYWLQEDEFEGYGRHFRITRGFELPRRSQIIDGRTWAAVCFQGNLDGDGHTLRNLAYTGGSDATKDSGVGLFKNLFNAEIRNLKLSGALITNAASQVGLIAGSAGGKTTLSDIAVEGTIQAVGDSVGGLVGGASGQLLVERVEIDNLTVSARNCGALVVGAFRNGSLTVENVTTHTHVFSVEGAAKIGGIVGSVTNAETLTVKDITIEHTVDSESSDVKVISADSDCAGGIAGRVISCGNTEINRCTIKAPVSGASCVALIIGEAMNANMRLSDNLLASVVSGGTRIGGFFGRVCNMTEQVVFGSGNRYVVKQTASAGVKGEKLAGGIAGDFEGENMAIKFESDVEIAVNISASGGYAGGAFGSLGGITAANKLEFDVSKLRFSSSTMRVEGGGEGVGGVVGHCHDCDFYGNTKFDLSQDIPYESHLTGVADIVVKGGSTVGGIIGRMEGGTLHSLVSGASVSATAAEGEWHGCGGIVGYISGDVYDCAFKGTASGIERLGGIIGFASEGSAVYNCVNYADITGARDLGGVVGRMMTRSGKPSRVSLCVNYGNLTDGFSVGGIIGGLHTKSEFHDSKDCSYIEKCGNWGDINANGNGNYGVGGIVGDYKDVFACLRYCSNYGNVRSMAVAKAIGGVAGVFGVESNNRTTVYECMNAGRVECDVASTKLGGVVGHFHSGDPNVHAGNCTMHDCVNTGSIPGDQKDDTGGIVGIVTSYTDTYRTFNRGMVSHGNAIIGTHSGGTIFYHDHNYYLEDTGKSWPSSTSVKKEKITDESVYKEFDFEKIWKMTEYGPTLRNIIW